jgi:CMP-N,N'-diacetyllegionaminic acid synthase
MSALCIIGARGGSKGLPGKNLRKLAGIPLIAHSIHQALESRCFDAIALSSEDSAILTTAEQHGATHCIRRPEELATDTASALDMVVHAVASVEVETGAHYDVICLLQPTSPCRNAADIRAAFTLLKESHAETVVSATPSAKSPYSTILEKNLQTGRWRPCCATGEDIPERRQDAPPTYDLNGAIYLWQRTAFDISPHPLHHQAELYIMPHSRSVDIDTALDFALAELVMQGTIIA